MSLELTCGAEYRDYGPVGGRSRAERERQERVAGEKRRAVLVGSGSGRGLGLSMSHIRTGHCSAVVYEGAGLVVVNGITGVQHRVRGRGLRGRVSGFSQASRRRMLVKLGKVRRDALCSAVFLTLTYPAAFSPDPEAWKGDLKAYVAWLGRAYPGCAGFWRMEAQRRGAPHFHLMVFGAGYVAKRRAKAAWYRIVGSGDAKHLDQGVRVESIRSPRQAVYYVSKYCGKEAEHDYRGGPGGRVLAYTGRQWGVFARDRVPWGEPVEVYVGSAGVRDSLVGFLVDESGYRPLARRGVTERVVAFCESSVGAVRDVLAVARACNLQAFYERLGPAEEICYFSPLSRYQRQLSFSECGEQTFARAKRERAGERWVRKKSR